MVRARLTQWAKACRGNGWVAGCGVMALNRTVPLAPPPSIRRVFDTSNFRKAFQTAACAVALGRKVGPEDWQYEGLLPYDLRRSAGLLFAI